MWLYSSGRGHVTKGDVDKVSTVGYQLLSIYMYFVFVIYEMSKTTFATTEITAQKSCSVTHNYKV